MDIPDAEDAVLSTVAAYLDAVARCALGEDAGPVLKCPADEDLGGNNKGKHRHSMLVLQSD